MNDATEKTQLKQGQALCFITAVDGSLKYSVGLYHCESITVEEVSGQCAAVPWARIKFSNGRGDILVNLAHVLAVG